MSAKFFYYPEPDGNHKVEIDLTEGLSELFSDFDVISNDGRGMDGSLYRSVGRNGEVITIQRERMAGGQALAMKLIALQNHLDRGYSCQFTADHTKAWCAPVSVSPTGGDLTLLLDANPFRSIVHYSGTDPVPADDDYIVIENQPPGMLQEVIKVSSTTVTHNGGGTITPSERIAFTYPGLPFARWYRYWPILKRPKEDLGRSIVTNEHGINWSLNIRLVPDYSALFAFHNGPNTERIDPGLLPDSPASGALPDREGQVSIDGFVDTVSDSYGGEGPVDIRQVWSRIE